MSEPSGDTSPSGDHLDELLAGADTDTSEDTADTSQDSSTDAVSPTEGETSPGDTTSAESGDTDQSPVSRADLEREAQRISDRTVNAVLKELRGGSTRKPTKQAAQSESRPEADATGPDVREARMAFREYVADTHTFVDASERAIANTLGSSVIAAQLSEHGDPDRAGSTAATQVGEQLSAYRRAVEKATVAALRKRGALTDTTSGGTGSAPAGSAPQPANIADKRQAARENADRINNQLGHTAG